MSAADTLAAWGILRPDDVVQLADGAGLPLAAAAALLEQESGGGHNVWGHDNVATGGIYVKGSEVTRETYDKYRAARKAHTVGPQGVGPCQLTSEAFQDRADAAGGCWDPIANMRVGFALLATYARDWGMEAAFRAYNGGPAARAGGNPAADRYAETAMDRYRRWIDRLGPDSATPNAPHQEDDMPLSPADLDAIANATVTKLLGTPLKDLYPDVPTRTLTVADTLAWAAAHAGRAETQLVRLRDELAKGSGDLTGALRAALDALGPLELAPAKGQ